MSIRIKLLAITAVLACLHPPRSAAESMDATIDGKQGTYALLDSASKPWRLCAVLPHAKDHYYWEAAWGLVEQARKTGVDIGIYQAGGYEGKHIPEQKRQIQACIDNHADAVLIAAIDSAGLEHEESVLAAHGIVIIDLLNELDGNFVTAHSHHDLVETGRLAAQYILGQAAGEPLRVGWFPGPRGPRWSEEFDMGVRDDFKGYSGNKSSRLIDGGWAPTDRDAQATLVRNFAENDKADAILANAIAAVFAARFYAYRADAPRKIVSLYTTDEVIAEMRAGRIDAMVASRPAEQSRIAVDLAIRALEHKAIPRVVSLPLRIITRTNIEQYVMETRELLPSSRIPLPSLPPLAD